MRFPHFIQGALFGPVLIGLALILKVACPAPAGAGCFADYLAMPIFLPLTFVYQVFGQELVLSHELVFILLYWSMIGFLIGLIFDLRKSPSQY